MKPYLAPVGFMKDLFKQKPWIILWVSVLMVVNLGGAWLWHEPLAQLVFYTFMITAVFMMLLYYQFGYERILGLGHILWLILVPYLILHVAQLNGAIFYYVCTVIVINSISLLFDINDVYIYVSNKLASRGHDNV